MTPDGALQALTVPLHKDLDVGTDRGIYRRATRLVPEDELAWFYDG